MTSRRGFCRAVGSLACVGLGGCKIEPILSIESEDPVRPHAFPDPPPQIPDQLADAETTLRVLTEQLLEREQGPLTTGDLRERPSEDAGVVPHLQELIQRFGATAAGEDGSWLQLVVLDIVEQDGAAAKVRLRRKTAADDLEQASEGAAEQGGEPAAEQGSEPAAEQEDERAVDLTAIGAFRQLGPSERHVGLPLGPVLDYPTTLVSEKLEGRVALVRAPAELDLEDPSAPAHVDVLLASIRDAGAHGCLLLTDDEGPAIDRFRARWQRQVRDVGGGAPPMPIEGLVGKAAQAAILAAQRDDAAWVLDVDLATRNYQLQAHNLLGAVVGRERAEEAVILTCAWDTPDPSTAETDTTRLLITLATFFQIAEWSRRSTPPKCSVILLATVDAGLSAGTTVHATRVAELGIRTKAVIALDRPTREPGPAVVLSGRYHSSTAELARRAVSADGRDLLLADRLALPSLVPYLRLPGQVMTIGTPEPDAPATPASSESPELAAEPAIDTLLADVRVLRNLVLALANS